MGTANNMPGQRKLKHPKEELFVKLYVELLNGTEAALRAGYGTTRPSAAGFASSMLKRDEIRDRIDFILQKRVDEAARIQQKINKELQQIAFSNITELVEFNARGTDFNFAVDKLRENGGAVQSISIQGGKAKKKEIKLHDKLKAIEILQKQIDVQEKIRATSSLESHEAMLKSKGIIPEDKEEIEDDGFIEAMQDIADNMEDDSFVYTEGIDDKDEELLD